MELFSELYGCYYTVVAQIMRQAHGKGIDRADIDRLVGANAFSESGLHLIPRLLSGDWDLLRENGGLYQSKLKNRETALPLTALQKAWLKALLQDRRIRLFMSEEDLALVEEQLVDVDPLFLPENFHIFDAATDGDNYEDEGYIERFRMILAAIKSKTPLLVQYESGKGGRMVIHFLPKRMLYSAKDDKFRAVGRRLAVKGSKPVLLNLARIKDLTEAEQPAPQTQLESKKPEHKRTVSLAISDERNALERCMLQFAAYDKQTVFDEETGRYLCDIDYDPLEETELLIRILSFGPVLEVLGPEAFLAQVRERVRMQIERMQIEC